MKQMDDNIGYVLKKLEDMGQLDNTIVVFTTDNGAEVITFPDGGTTPFKGGKLTTWEGGMRAPLVVRWPGHIKPGTVKNEIFASLDWVPDARRHRRRPQGRRAQEADRGRHYPGIVKTTLDGVDQRDYLEGKSEKSARDTFFYYSGATPSAVRYKNWKMYFAMRSRTAPAGHAGSPDVPLGAGRQHQARSIRDGGRRSTKGALGWAARSPPRAPPTSTTGTCCPSASCCGSRSSRPTRRSRRCRIRRATTSTRSWSSSRRPRQSHAGE